MFRRCSHWMYFALLVVGPATAAEVTGVQVGLVDYSGPATFDIKATDKYAMRIDVDPQTEREAMTLQVDLPIAGANAWPFNDVAVFDSEGRAVPVQRSGIEWHKLSIRVPPKRSFFVVRAIDAARHRPQLRSEQQRVATDLKTGASATITKWYDGRRAAVSLRFDDSHPTHLSKAIPILNAYGFRGTFMVNPGGHPVNSRRRSSFEEHRAEWEAVARRGEHEFANHTMNHRGADDDESMEHEIGDAAKAIWKLLPQKSKLAALNLGGGTQWVTTRTLSYYLDKYHLFDASSNSTGMDDSYGDRVATFRRLLEAHLERGLWYKAHYHSIGDGLSSSEANFRAALDIVKEHQDQLWIAGMADIYKYQTERLGAKLEIENGAESRVIVKFSCYTIGPELYDQPLTIDVTLPELWTADGVVVADHKKAQEIDFREVPGRDRAVVRFDVQPSDAEYSIQKKLELK